MSYTLVHRQRPWTTNGERTWSPYKRAKQVREWRGAFAAHAIEGGLPRPIVGPVVITCMPILRDHRVQDVAACLPAYKAAVDGLVDAGILPGDGPHIVQAVMFLAPEINAAYGDALTLLIEPLEPQPN